MTTVKISGKPSTSAQEAVELYADRLYRNQAARIMVVGELKHAVRNEPAPDEDKDRSVELRITGLEVANPEQDEALRKVMRALYVSRTAQGTLDEDGDVELSATTLRLAADRLSDMEVARLRVGARYWADYARRVFQTDKISEAELRHELEAIQSGLERVLNPGKEDEGE